MKRLTILLCLFSSLAFAQGRVYTVSREDTLSAAASVVTIQQPATGARTVRLVSAFIYCSVDCDITLERDGTAATATAMTATPASSLTPAAKARVYYGSNVGTGTVLGKYSVAAGNSLVLDLPYVALYGNGTGKNVTLRSSSVTGNVKIVVAFVEES